MQSLPLFPAFRKFTYEDQDWYNEFFLTFEPYADFSFGNFMVWLDQYDDLEVSQHKGNLIFRSTVVFMGAKKIMTLLGQNAISDTVNLIFLEQARRGELVELMALTNVIANDVSILSGPYSITTDRDNFEYLYNASAWATMEGSNMRKLRREVTTFEKEFGKRSLIKKLDLSDTSVVNELKFSIAKWDKVFSKNDKDQCEALILKRLFNNASKLPYKGIGLYIDDILEGFLLYQRFPQSYAVTFGHVKASYSYRYMFDYLLHKSAEVVLEDGVTQINFEQDLGIEGLRTHKESLKPEGFYEKFTVRPRVL